MIIDCTIHTIRYGNHTVLENLNIRLNCGDCLVISGDSGSGKSTALLYIAGLLENKHVSVDASRKIAQQTKLIYVAQDPDSNIISNDVKSELILYSGANISKVNSVISKYRIPERFLERSINELSGGQKQLLAVLCGIIQDVDLYILDEPTAMLDNENSMIVIEIIKELINNSKAAIIATHNKMQFSFGNENLDLDSKKKKFKADLFSINQASRRQVYFLMNDIHFAYKKDENIFKEFNLALVNGDILLISGKNGTGKTTLAKLMAGLKKPQKGTIELNKKKIRNVPMYLPLMFSYSLQNPNWQLLFESVEKEVNSSVIKFAVENKDSSIANLNELLANVNINKSKEPRELSFGQKKFISNFSYYHDPLIHFFDEPDLGADEVFYNYFIKYLTYRKNKGLISIVVSHDPNKYKNIANKYISL